MSSQGLTDEKTKDCVTVNDYPTNKCEGSEYLHPTSKTSVSSEHEHLHDMRNDFSVIGSTSSGNDRNIPTYLNDGITKIQRNGTIPKKVPLNKLNDMAYDNGTPSQIDNDCSEIYQVINKDTGDVYDIRDLDNLKPASSIGSCYAITSGEDNINRNPKSIRTSARESKFDKFRIHNTSKNKKKTDAESITLIDEKIAIHNGPVWVMEFSNCGRYLATGGKTGTILLWTLFKTKQHHIPTSGEKPLVASYSKKNKIISLLPAEPHHLEGHYDDVIDLSWSGFGDLLISASLDQTVRLWNSLSLKCINVFRHNKMVTGVDFHPSLKDHFLSSCIDGIIRLWNFSDTESGKVKSWVQTRANVTSCKFTPDGSMFVAGLANGKIQFFRSDMKLFDTLDCKNRKGQDKDGKKVSGLMFQPVLFKESSSSVDECSSDGGDSYSSSLSNFSRMSSKPAKPFVWNLLVTTNDSRLRVVSMKNFTVIKKFKDGATIQQYPIKSRFDESGKYIICASEDGRVYFWNYYTSSIKDTNLETKKVSSHESFESSSTALTDAHFVPETCVLNAFHANYDDNENMPNVMNTMIITSDKEGTIRAYLRKISI